MEDKNAKFGSERTERIKHDFGVPGIDKNRECLIAMCAARGMALGGLWFKGK